MSAAKAAGAATAATASNSVGTATVAKDAGAATAAKDAGAATAALGCALLAGGAGRRMGGQNKAALWYAEEQFGERLRAMMEESGLPCYQSVAHYEQKLPAGWTRVPDVVCGSHQEYIGPLGGLYSCLRQAREDGLAGLLFLPCDAPLYPLEALQALRGLMEEELRRGSADRESGEAAGPAAGSATDGAEESPAAAPADVILWQTSDGRKQVVFGAYFVGCLPRMEEQIAKEDYTLRHMLEGLRCRVLDPADYGIPEESFTNVNTPEEYAALQEK